MEGSGNCGGGQPPPASAPVCLNSGPYHGTLNEAAKGTQPRVPTSWRKARRAPTHRQQGPPTDGRWPLPRPAAGAGRPGASLLDAPRPSAPTEQPVGLS